MIILEKQEHEIYAKKEKITEFYHPEKIVYCCIFGIFNVF